jgi:hypothetical protein
MKLQDKMHLPLGYVLKEVGQRPPDTELVDPFQTLRQSRHARLFLPQMVRVERRLRRQGAHPDVPTLVPRQPDTLTAVY